jgi:hypothetical protein
MSERRFTPAEADALLPELRERLARIRDARERLIASARVVRERVAADPGGVAGDPGHFEAARVLREELARLAELGVVLRDPESGLVDFPGEVDGRPVWLCWRLGEERVAHYHELDAGFAGRRPL